MNRNLIPGIIAVHLLLGSPALAGTQTEARLALHYSGTCDKCIPDICGTYSPVTKGTLCSEYVTIWTENPGIVPVAYLVLALADSAAGVQSVQFGLHYDYPDFTPCWWMTCGDQEFRHDSLRGEPWPAPGSGNRIWWDPDTNCQRKTLDDGGAYAVLGAFELHQWTAGDHSFSVTVDSTLLEPGILVTDCKGSESLLATPGGSMGTQTPGFNPCLGTVAVRSTTWGRIKTTYQNP